MISLPEGIEKVVNQLVEEFPDQVFQEFDPKFKSIQQSYWSQTQKELKPRCYFQPHTASELSRGVSLCAKANCGFGVKSGGHGHYAGQSCLEDGIQFDLVRLNKIEICKDKGTAIIGPGCTWRSVYTTLQKENVLVVGGRAADVGVGGFLIGGGISFYAAELGWGIDRIRSFEIVLASGEIIRASKENHPCLFKALRGGGNNLGIISAFELELVEYNGMWGGRTTIDQSHAEDALEAYVDFIPKLELDPKGHTIIIFDYHMGNIIVRQYLAYTQPSPDLPIFDRLRKVPTVDSSLRLLDYTDLAADIAELQGDAGLRYAVATLTVRLDYQLLKFAYDTYREEAQIVDGHGFGCLEFHALPRTPKGIDNMYGLEHGDHPLIAIMLAFGTVHKRYDFTLISLQHRILDKIRKEAEARGLFHPFLFANYAGPFQDVAASYGSSNLKFISEVAKIYDPDSTFQRLQPGGYKLGMANSPDSSLGTSTTAKDI